MAGDTAPLLDFIGYVARSLVEHPEDVVLEEVDEGRHKVFELSVHADDLSAITGEDDSVAEALRTVLDACAYKHRARAELVILEEPSEPIDEDDDDFDDEDDEDDEDDFDEEDDFDDDEDDDEDDD